MTVSYTHLLAMILPISTPPNALAHATGMIQQKDMEKVSTPPKEDRFSRMLLPAMARMGTSNAAVAV